MENNRCCAWLAFQITDLKSFKVEFSPTFLPYLSFGVGFCIIATHNLYHSLSCWMFIVKCGHWNMWWWSNRVLILWFQLKWVRGFVHYLWPLHVYLNWGEINKFVKWCSPLFCTLIKFLFHLSSLNSFIQYIDETF